MRTDLKRSLWMCVALTGAVLPGITAAHSIQVLHGSALVDGSSLVIHLEVSGEDLLHGSLRRPHDASGFARNDLRRAIESHGQMLLRRIRVRDDHGEVIDGLHVTWRCDGLSSERISERALGALRIRYQLQFEWERSNRYLSFQQRTIDAQQGLYSNIVLRVRDQGQVPATVQLSRGGNVEVVPLVSGNETFASTVSSAHSCMRSFVLRESQRSMRVVHEAQDRRLTTSVFIPTALLSSWIPLLGEKNDFVNSHEQDQHRLQILDLIEKGHAVRINGEVARNKVANVEFLDVAELSAPPSSARRLSVWTSRAKISFDYVAAAPIEEIALDWSLFNSHVLSVPALVVHKKICQEYDVSTYQPGMEWSAINQTRTKVDASK